MFSSPLLFVLACFGAFTIAVAYNSWRCAQVIRITRSSKYRELRYGVYRNAWDKLEQLYKLVLSPQYKEERFYNLLADLNLHLIKIRLFIDRSEERQMKAYISSIRYIAEKLESQPSDMSEIKDAQKEAEMNRKLVFSNFQQVLDKI